MPDLDQEIERRAELLKDHLRQQIYLFCFKDKLGFYQILPWWVHLANGYAGYKEKL